MQTVPSRDLQYGAALAFGLAGDIRTTQEIAPTLENEYARATLVVSFITSYGQMIGQMYPFWSSNGHQLFYETADYRIMVVDYRAEGDVFKPSKPRLWSTRNIFYPGVSNMDIAPDGKRVAILTAPQASIGEGSSVHVTMLFNYFDELKRKLP